jgi:glycosyltransferase involved in cell wall biosynthesis
LQVALALCGALHPFVDLPRQRLFGICAGLSAAIRRLQPRVVYCWSDLANLLGGFVAAHLNVPRTILGQRTFPPPFWVDPPLAERYREGYHALLAKPNMTMVNISAASARAYTAWLWGRHPIRVVRNGFDPSSVAVGDSAAGDKLRRRLGIPPDAPVVGTVMRFAPEKDPVLWLEAVAAIARLRPDAHFILNGHGHGDIAQRLFWFANSLGLEGRFHMPGAIVEVGSVYRAMTVFLLTSRTDATPNAMLEAQACGIPVVAPATGGIGETMLDGLTGTLVREPSAGTLAAAVAALLNDPARLEQAKVHGPAFIAERFGLERMVDETIACWE